MTQAYNLAILANAVDTSGKLNVGTNATGTLPVANGGTGTTTPSLVAGTNISITGTWPNQTVTNTAAGASGTVTSVATGNGLQGGTITTTGTLSIAAAGYQTVGSIMALQGQTGALSPNSNYSGSNAALYGYDADSNSQSFGNASGTYRMLGATTVNQRFYVGVRVS